VTYYRQQRQLAEYRTREAEKSARQNITSDPFNSDVDSTLSNFLNLAWWDKYQIYLSSKRWEVKRQKILERDKYLCQSCLELGATEVHHLSYDRVGCELSQDLVSLCSDCHNAITTMSRAKRVEIGDSDEMKLIRSKIIYGCLYDYLDNDTFNEAVNIVNSSNKPLAKLLYSALLGIK